MSMIKMNYRSYQQLLTHWRFLTNLIFNPALLVFNFQVKHVFLANNITNLIPGMLSLVTKA